MKIVVAAVGRLKTGHFEAGCREYLGRLQHGFPTRIAEVRDANRQAGGSPDRWRAEEAAGLLAAVPAGAVLVALDERGPSMASRPFAEWLGKLRDQSTPAVVFALGGPDGLDESVRQRANRLLSLGPMTLPHELARLVLLEQLYRAATILAGAPYHRD